MHFEVYRNTKKSLNIITFHDRKYGCVENSIRFLCQSNNKNFNMLLPKCSEAQYCIQQTDKSQILILCPAENNRKYHNCYTLLYFSLYSTQNKSRKITLKCINEKLHIFFLFSNSCAFLFIVSHINLPNSIALTANEKKAGSTNLLKPPVARKLLQK